MGLSDDGFYKKLDFTQQAKFVAEYITDSSKKVLEIGAGKLFNTKFLAKSFPDNQFTAMDLPNPYIKNEQWEVKLPQDVPDKEIKVSIIILHY